MGFLLLYFGIFRQPSSALRRSIMAVMTVIAHGIDLVPIDRIAALLKEHGDRFRQRCFTDAEQAYADAYEARRAERYAVLKALGTGWRDGIAWTDMEVINEPSGRPVLHLSGRCAELASNLGISRWHISISHAGGYAMASAIACGEGQANPVG